MLQQIFRDQRPLIYLFIYLSIYLLFLYLRICTSSTGAKTIENKSSRFAEFYALFRLISVNVAKYILSFRSICPGGTKFEIFCDHTAYLHFIF